MSNLNSLLHLGASTANAHQRRLNTVQNNLANATTPGYRRQRVNLITLGGGLGAGSFGGVGIGGTQSAEAPLVARQLAFHRGDF